MCRSNEEKDLFLSIKSVFSREFIWNKIGSLEYEIQEPTKSAVGKFLRVFNYPFEAGSRRKSDMWQPTTEGTPSKEVECNHIALQLIFPKVQYHGKMIL